jgi:hypothetical protein
MNNKKKKIAALMRSTRRNSIQIAHIFEPENAKSVSVCVGKAPIARLRVHILDSSLLSQQGGGRGVRARAADLYIGEFASPHFSSAIVRRFPRDA